MRSAARKSISAIIGQIQPSASHIFSIVIRACHRQKAMWTASNKASESCNSYAHDTNHKACGLSSLSVAFDLSHDDPNSQRSSKLLAKLAGYLRSAIWKCRGAAWNSLPRECRARMIRQEHLAKRISGSCGETLYCLLPGVSR